MELQTSMQESGLSVQMLPGRPLHGRFVGTLIGLHVDHSGLQHCIPRSLRTNSRKYGATHPLLVMTGAQQNVCSRLFGRRFPYISRLNYHETCLIIPDLLPADCGISHPDPVTHFGRLYLDRAFPTFVGRWPYGWSKCLASVRRRGNSLSLSRMRRGQLLRIEYHGSSDHDAKAFQPICEWLQQPIVIGRDAWLRSTDMRFDWEAAEITTESLTAELGARLLIGVQPQTIQTTDPGCSAFHLSVPWSLCLRSSRGNWPDTSSSSP